MNKQNMSIRKKYNVIGIMSGTSMDGLDCSFIKTNGTNFVQIIKESTFEFTPHYKNKLRKIISRAPKNNLSQQIKYFYENEDYITNNLLKYIRIFLRKINTKKNIIDLIGISGQTVLHNPKKKISIQLGSCSKINKILHIPIIGNFRENDINNGGQGAPIGSFYHKYILNKVSKKTAIINLGGISNITYSSTKELIAFDMGPGNSLIDDLTFYFYKKRFDHKGNYAKKGSLIKEILNDFQKDVFFKQNYPKSLDREYFNRFFNILKNKKNTDSIHTASMMSVMSIIMGIKLLKKNIKKIIVTGGGRKNNFLMKSIASKLNKTKIMNIDQFGYNGDLLEAQMFAYLAVRSLKKLPLSTPNTTGVNKSITGGYLFS